MDQSGRLQRADPASEPFSSQRVSTLRLSIEALQKAVTSLLSPSSQRPLMTSFYVEDPSEDDSNLTFQGQRTPGNHHFRDTLATLPVIVLREIASGKQRWLAYSMPERGWQVTTSETTLVGLRVFLS